MKRQIRTGKDTDLATTCPSLIPIPKTFAKEGLDLVKSHVADGIINGIRQSMILSDLGYTPQRLVPLYVRNTLVESNGCYPGGDQTKDTMAKDARYTHTFGRQLNRFEPSELLEAQRLKKIAQKKLRERLYGESENQRKAREEKDQRRVEKLEAQQAAKERDAVRATGMNRSLVRLVFGNGHSKHNTYYD